MLEVHMLEVSIPDISSPDDSSPGVISADVRSQDNSSIQISHRSFKGAFEGLLRRSACFSQIINKNMISMETWDEVLSSFFIIIIN